MRHPLTRGFFMAKADALFNLAKLFRVLNDYDKKLKTLIKGKRYPTLKGPSHVDRVMVFPWLAGKIPDHLQDSVYFEGQGQLPVISKDFAKFISEKMGIPVQLFSTEV